MARAACGAAALALQEHLQEVMVEARQEVALPRRGADPPLDLQQVREAPACTGVG